jgi:CelD/BcsL family acetyltransferase involved in cellulose biosynthesis
MTLLETMTRRAAPVPAATSAGPDWRVETTSDIDGVARAWLSLEVSGIATPYQTLGWQRAALTALHPGAKPLIVVLRDPRGATAGLLPLIVARKSGVAVAFFPGGKHANYNMGLFTPEAARQITADSLRKALREAAAVAGIDVFAFRNQPRAWRGFMNPLALLPHQATASGAWRADLTADADAFVGSLMSSESRKKLRHKERKLAEIGPLAYVEASTPAEARALLVAFLAQKKARFAAMGITNPFDQPEAVAFLEQSAVRPLEEGPPAPVSLFGLKVGERVAAVFGGVVHGGRFSGMFTSFDSAADVGRHSPGDLLILHLVREMCARGLTAFDLGVGDAAYKSDYCKVREELFDSFLPMTFKGRAAALVLAGGYRLKARAASRKDLVQPIRKLLGR